MIQVLVHTNSPFPGRKFSEKGMRMAGAFRFAAFRELVYELYKFFLFALKVPLVGKDKAFVGWSVFLKRLFVGKKRS